MKRYKEQSLIEGSQFPPSDNSKNIEKKYKLLNEAIKVIFKKLDILVQGETRYDTLAVILAHAVLIDKLDLDDIVLHANKEIKFNKGLY